MSLSLAKLESQGWFGTMTRLDFKSFVLNGIVWYCRAFYCVARYCMVPCMVPWYCMVLYCIAWYCMIWEFVPHNPVFCFWERPLKWMGLDWDGLDLCMLSLLRAPLCGANKPWMARVSILLSGCWLVFLEHLSTRASRSVPGLNSIKTIPKRRRKTRWRHSSYKRIEYQIRVTGVSDMIGGSG